MITDLFVVSSRIDPATVEAAIPPACRRQASVGAVMTEVDGDLLLELPEWRPRMPSRHLVPSMSMLTDAPYTVRFELSGWADGGWSPWVATATIGPGAFAPLPTEAGGVACDTDVYAAAQPLERLRLRVRLGTADVPALAASPWMAALSACDLSPLAPETVPLAPETVPLAPETGTVAVSRLPVPALSQLEAPPEIALRICSPTSVAMVLGYWGAPESAVSVAADVFHAGTDSYGVWPAAIRAAGRRGLAGYVLRFPDWASAAWCLERKLPIIASVGYEAGELTGAPLAATAGHLIVLTGCDRTHALVNDPVAPTAADVPRRYRLDQLQRAWLARKGVGYVLFDADRA